MKEKKIKKIKESFGGMGGGQERKKERKGWEKNGKKKMGKGDKEKWRKMEKKTTFNMEHSAFK